MRAVPILVSSLAVVAGSLVAAPASAATGLTAVPPSRAVTQVSAATAKPSVRLKTSTKRVVVGDPLKLRVKVRKSPAKVMRGKLQVRAGKGSWHALKKVRVRTSRTTNTSIRLATVGTYRVRAVVGQPTVKSPAVKLVAYQPAADTVTPPVLTDARAVAMTRARLEWGLPQAADRPEQVQVAYRSYGGAQWQEQGVDAAASQTILTGLKPGTTYDVKLSGRRGSATADSDVMQITTPSAESTVYAAGDIGQCGGAAQSTAALIPQDAIFLGLGDMVQHEGTAQNYAECYHPYFGRLLPTTYPVPGNHDYATGGQPYFDYFGARAGRLGESWYSLRLGSWQFLMLDANCLITSSVGGCGTKSPQYQWVQQQLEQTDAKCLAVAWHYPRPISSSEAVGSLKVGNLMPLVNLMWSHGMDVALSGHVHNYRRYSRQAADGSAAVDGVREFGVGTGGAYLMTLPVASSRIEVMAQQHGVLQLTLGSDSYDWRFLSVDGAEVDYGTDTC